jgi:DNA-binding NtrC family response regulator
VSARKVGRLVLQGVIFEGMADDFEGVETYRLSDADTSDHTTPRWLVVLGGGPTHVVELTAGATLTIGRSSDCEVVLSDRAISRRHATLHVGPTLEVEDLGSANGLVVAGARVEPRGRIPVPVGSTIQIGTTLLVVDSGTARPDVDAEGPTLTGREGEPDHGDAVVMDEAMVRLYEVVARVAPTRLNVLVLGETGVGKELLAEAVHASSPRSDGPFVKINCAALAPQLLESELFGHERGAFTGADRARAGLVEAANGGTLLLDEVGEMPLELQAKLLRTIEDQKVKRVGAVTPRDVDVRYVASTNRDLAIGSERGTFRRDLYYRLNGVRLEIPPLRARPAEIVPLAKRFAESVTTGAEPPEITEEVISALHRYPWPGNVRELRNVMERAVAMCDQHRITLSDLPSEVASGRPPGSAGATSAGGEADAPPSTSTNLREDLAAMEKRRIIEALERCGGNQTQAAKLLGMPRRTLIMRVEEYGLPRPRKGRGKKKR